MKKDISKLAGLDVHKESIVIAVAEAGRDRAQVVCTIKHDVGKLLKALAKLGAPGAHNHQRPRQEVNKIP